MVSTPPKAGGSPSEEAWRRWAEEQITDLINGTAVQDTRVKAVVQTATNVGGTAAEAAVAATVAQEAANNVAAEAVTLGARVSGASTLANFASEQALAAQEAAAAAADDIKVTKSVFDFNDDGLDISRPGGVYSLHLDNEGITINEGDVPVSLWNAGQMIVDKFVGTEVVLANHKIESNGTRTIFRSM